jgi:hypothetical protein
VLATPTILLNIPTSLNTDRNPTNANCHPKWYIWLRNGRYLSNTPHIHDPPRSHLHTHRCLRPHKNLMTVLRPARHPNNVPYLYIDRGGHRGLDAIVTIATYWPGRKRLGVKVCRRGGERLVGARDAIPRPIIARSWCMGQWGDTDVWSSRWQSACV